ncbi:rho GTPase-activating protein 5-like [Vicia villosa]|uniref:rho GTPase-activating protein 5-like n=1 Tax=Vicia villosa TaxID=3911 RepID=UPI00273CDD3A|nr:rho GTPase-activating protein 5-like [Vicia villosa]
MMEVLQFPSPSSCSSSPCARLNPNDAPHQTPLLNNNETETVIHHFQIHQHQQQQQQIQDKDRERDQLSILTLLIATFRKSLIGCSTTGSDIASSMEIGWPSNVRHVAHVTFDRFHGFLGLPVEFEPEVPRRPPSASTSVFGVSTESMQLSFDARGNSVPTILLLMQRHLYAQGGLQAEGIFRINAENSQEEFVREQLNRGVVPNGIDVHCLAGLIKAWFRELPTGILDPLSPEQVMQSQTEEECAQLVRLLPPTEAALLDWAVNLMADVAQLEHLNKMNARNVAMVFAPNMTHMVDPLTALMYAVQVMNFLKTLVVMTLKEREESITKLNPVSNLNSFDDDGHQNDSQVLFIDDSEYGNNFSDEDSVFVTAEPSHQSPTHLFTDGCETESESKSLPTSAESFISNGNRLLVDSCPCGVVSQICSLAMGDQTKICNNKSLQLNTSDTDKCSAGAVEKNRGIALIGRINSRSELTDSWR